MPIEETLVIIKPDAYLKRQDNAIKDVYKRAGLKVKSEISGCVLTENQVFRLYEEHVNKFYFAALLLAMRSGPCSLLILEGEGAIVVVRHLNGATDPKMAEPGTIRHDFMSAGGPFNTVHASDSQAAFERERKILFGK